MGREFTNALSQTPLWNFALGVYGKHQAALLRWQQAHQANVNVLIALAFCKQQQRTIALNQAFENATRIADVIIRTRNLRLSFKGSPNYELAKEFELSLEGWHLQWLSLSLGKGEVEQRYPYFESLWGIKKGALAPFIDSLLD